jgi:hypothetical protein
MNMPLLFLSATLRSLSTRIKAPFSIAAALGLPLLVSPLCSAAGSQFNPQISLILDGVYYADSESSQANDYLQQASSAFTWSDEAHAETETHSVEGGHDHGGDLSEGFALREQELIISSAIDAYFDGTAVLAFSEDALEIEEAYVTTRRMPYGLSVKGGRFYSGIGYQNSRHSHQWAFVDQNLAYQSLLGGHGLSDTGVQLTWLPDIALYTLIGIEYLQGGSSDTFGGRVESEEEREELGLSEALSRPALKTVFIKLSPDFSASLGDSHAVQLGAWYARADQDQAIFSGHLEHEGLDHDDLTDEEVELGLQGQASLQGLDLVYGYDAIAAYGKGDVKLQAEYLRMDKDWTVQNDEYRGSSVAAVQDAYYLQAEYGIAERWRTGLRYAVTGAKNRLQLPAAQQTFAQSSRQSVMLTWQASEFSRIRLQYSQADLAGRDDQVEQFLLQFNYSLGAHGAHSF